MATIHRIEPTSARSGNSQNTDRLSSSAKIILFPGVRYERWAEPQERTGRRSAKQRDRLEIGE